MLRGTWPGSCLSRQRGCAAAANMIEGGGGGGGGGCKCALSSVLIGGLVHPLWAGQRSGVCDMQKTSGSGL